MCRVPADYPTPPGVVLPIPNFVPTYIDEADAIAHFRSYVASKCCWDHSILDELQVVSVLNFFEFSRSRKCVSPTSFPSKTHSKRVPPFGGKLRSPKSRSLRRIWASRPRLGSSSCRSHPLPRGPSPFRCHLPNSSGLARIALVGQKNVLHAGSGRTVCEVCRGRGTEPCPECAKKEEPEEKLIACKLCSNSGFVTCQKCQGLGNNACDACSGRGQLKAYLEVTAEIRVEESTDTVEAGGLTHDYLKLLQGEIVYQYASLCLL